MGVITNIIHNKGTSNDRTWVFIDHEYCTSIRTRTWISFNLKVGDNVDCEALKERESFVWKNLYNEKSWEKEKIRLNYVSTWLKKYIPYIDVKIAGFGADSIDFIKEHPKEKGEPDLQIFLENTDTVVLFLEVTGTEYKKGDDYWIRPDKIDYIQKHSNQDIWIALHYSDAQKIVWIKPELNKKYEYFEINLKGAIEHFISFTDKSPEVKTSSQFKSYLDHKIQNARQ